MFFSISSSLVLVLTLFQLQSRFPTSVATETEGVYGWTERKNVKLSEDNKVGNEIDPGEISLFYGWFFDEDCSLSLLKISQIYFSSCFNRVPEFIDFIYKNMEEYNITNPFAFFRKPVDPDTLRPIDTYHVTAKFCGRLDCSSYARIAAPYIGKKFQIHIIGLFITAKTYGFRIKLLAEEEDIFVEKVAFRNNNSNAVLLEKPIFNEIDYAAILNGKTEGLTNFPNIHFLPQKLNFHPSNSKAHSTIGCAPDIEAVQTGLDLREIEALEASNDIPHKDYKIGVVSSAENLPGAILRRYGDVDKPLAFVIYPRDEMIVPATFKYYI